MKSHRWCRCSGWTTCVLVFLGFPPFATCFGFHPRNSVRPDRKNYFSASIPIMHNMRGGAKSLKTDNRERFISIRRKRRSLTTPTSLWTDASKGKDDFQSSTEGGKAGVSTSEVARPGSWPCFDDLDKRLIRITLPVMANLAINPLTSAVDVFWVNRMRMALATAGLGAATSIFDAVFFVASFLPSITATLISKENALNNKEGIQDAVCQALFVGLFMAIAANVVLFFKPKFVLKSVLGEGLPAMEYAIPYLVIRSFSFIPGLISLVGFAAFRGVQDTLTPVKISFFANIINVVLDPILIFWASMGVTGAAIATLVSEVVSAIVFLVAMRKRKLILFNKLFRLPAWKKLGDLLKGGFALQLRNVALNISLIAVQKVSQGIDTNGVAAAAHQMAIQVFRVGGIVLFAVSTVAQSIIPNDLVEVYDKKLKKTIGGVEEAKTSSQRLMSWGLILGIALGLIQLIMLPVIQRSTPLQEVRDAARGPAIIASIFQSINGLVFVGEGVMVGTGNFFELSLNTIIATAGCLVALNMWAVPYGVSGVWMGLGVFNIIRLIGVALYLRVYGPFAPKRKEKDGV